MKRKITFLIAAITAIMLITPPIKVVGQTRTNTTDVITASMLTATGTTYTSFSNVTYESDAVYAGASAKDASGNIQLRSSKSDAGIYTTESGGKIHSVSVSVGSGSNTLNVYGKHTAYSAVGDLFDADKRGTLIGSISATGTVNLGDNVDVFEYIGMCSNSGALYLASISIEWADLSSVAAPTFSPAAGTYIETQNVSISCETEGATIYYTTDNTTPTTSSSVYSSAISVSSTTTIKAIAAKSGMSNSSVASATYTIITNPCIVTLNSNGLKTTVIVPQDEEYDFPTPTNIPFGYEYRGWSTKTDLETITSDDVKSKFTPEENTATWNAVFGLTTYGDFVKVTSAPDDWSGRYLIVCESVSPTKAFNGSVGSNWGSCNDVTISSNTITKANAPTNGLVIVSEGSSSGTYKFMFYDGKYMNWTAKGKFSSGDSPSNYTISYETSPNRVRIQYSSNIYLRYNTAGGLRTYDSEQQEPIQLYKQSKGDPTGFYTSVSAPVAADIEITTPTVISNGTVLNMGTHELEIGTGGSLVIEDGGQLICSNSVTATVKKSISAATAKDVTNWYGISSSVHKSGQTYEEMGSVTNLLGGTYDMFYYKESESKWINQKATVSPYAAAYTNMESCRGYIYRNAADVVLSYAGETNVGEISQYTLSYTSELTNDVLKGINLVGNPYPHKIYKGVAFAVTADTLETGYYTIGGDGACTSTLNTVAIDVNQAVLVKAKSGSNGKKLTFKDKTKAPVAKSNNDNIKFIVSNSQYEDVAYALFDKGAGLDKINHRNADIPMLYINQDGADYAIATMGDETKSFNLNLKAMTMGQYTLSYKADGNFSYLHVIDRLTGEDVDMLMEGEYSFIASPSDAENRFIVRLEYSNGYENSEDSIFAYQSGSDIIVNGEGELQIFDVMGRRVATQYVSGVETINLQSHGVYIFKLNEKTQKIVVR